MKRNKNSLFNLICFLILSISSNSYSQLITNCGSDFYGVGEADIECDAGIIVTSTPSEGSEGTIIYGLIYSKYENVKFIPGHSKVRFIAYDTDQSREGNKSKSGTGGKKGGRKADPNLADTKIVSNTLKIFPNPVTSSLTVTKTKSNLISYDIYSIDGRLLINKNLKGSTNYSINLEHLKSGLHLLKLYFKNGNIINKHIIKQ